MAENPITAIKAILTGPRILDGLTVYPVTAARYLLLDSIGSSFLTGRTDLDPIDLLTSLYIMTTDARNFRGAEDVKKAALEWISLRKTQKLLKNGFKNAVVAVAEDFKLISYLAPDIETDKSAPRSSNGWIPHLIYILLSDTSLSLDEIIYDQPLARLILLLRQKHYCDGGCKALTLEDKELIDGMKK